MEFYSGQPLSANCLNGLVTRANNLCNQLRALQGRQATANLGKAYFPRRSSEAGAVGYWTRMPINLPPFTRFDVVRYGSTEVESYLQGGSWVSGVEGIHTLPTVRLCKRPPALLYIEPTEYRPAGRYCHDDPCSCFISEGTVGLGLSLYASCNYYAFPNLQLLADERCQFACVAVNQLCKIICKDCNGTEFCRMQFKKVSLRLFKQYWEGNIHRPDLYDIRKEHFGYSVDLQCSILTISRGTAVLYPPVIQSGCAEFKGGYGYCRCNWTGCLLNPRLVQVPCASIRVQQDAPAVLTYFYRCDCSKCKKPDAWTTSCTDCHGCVHTTTTCEVLPDPCYNYGYNWRNASTPAMYLPCYPSSTWHDYPEGESSLQFYRYDTEVEYCGRGYMCFHAKQASIGRSGFNHPEIVPVGRFYTHSEVVYNTCGCFATEEGGALIQPTEVTSEVHEWTTFCINKTPMVIYDRSLNGIGTFAKWWYCFHEIATCVFWDCLRCWKCVEAKYYCWATGVQNNSRLVSDLWERTRLESHFLVCRRAMTVLPTNEGCNLPPQYVYFPAPKDCWYDLHCETEVDDG